MTNDPLVDLLLDSVEIDRALLANSLKGILGVDSKTGNVILLSGFNKLNSLNKILAFLLGRKVSYLLDKSETEEVFPKEIPDATGIPSGTVHPKLRELKNSRIASQSEDGGYYVPSYQLSNAVNKINKELGK